MGREAARTRDSLLVFFLFSLVYALSASPVLGAAHDGVYYLRSIESGRHLLHPHHLLYNPVARLWWRATGMGDPVLAVEWLNALAGGLAAALLHRAVSRFAARPLAFFSTALWGFSFGPWFYSATIEVYLLPLPFLLGAWIALETPSTRRAAAGGVLVAFAVLFHQTNLLFLPCALYRLRKGGGRAAAAFLLPLLLLSGGGYLAAWRLAGGGDSFSYWSTSYLHEIDLGRFTLATPLMAAAGAGRFFFGGHFAFALPFDVLAAVREGHHLDDEFFLVRAMTGGQALLLLTASAAWCAAFLAFLADRARRAAGSQAAGGHAAGSQAASGHAASGRGVLVPALAWLLPYALFFSWWEPSNVEFWIATLLPLFLAIPALDPASPPRRAAWLLPAALALVNLFGSIRPLSDPGNDWYAAQAAAYRHLAPGQVVEVEDDWILGPYIERLTGATVVRKRDDPIPGEPGSAPR